MANSPRLAELADLITRREYNYAMCKARKHTEDLVRRYAADHNMEYTTLADTIEALYQGGVIGDASRENLHGIRILGNKAVHEDDNDAQDAKSAYEMLKKELGTYSDQKYTNPERTPVAITKDTGDQEYGNRRRHRDSREEEQEEGGIDVSYASGGRRPQRNQAARNTGKRRKPAGNDSTLYTVLKILIPVLIILLVVILLKSIFSGSGKPAEETTAEEITAAATEQATEEETTEAPTTQAKTTEAPTTEAPAYYRIKGEGVNIRLASDPTQRITQLNSGYVIGPITDYENRTGDSTYDGFARFAYEGKDVIVKKDYIEKVTD